MGKPQDSGPFGPKRALRGRDHGMVLVRQRAKGDARAQRMASSAPIDARVLDFSAWGKAAAR